MGKLALAAKITHVPSMYLSEMDGPHKGCREAAIEGHREISRRCRELGVDTIVVFDTHWLVNSGYHINNAAHFKGVYTSNELPHFIKNMPYEYNGNPALGELIANTATDMGVKTRAHSDTTLPLEYGTLVPMRYMNEDQHFKVVSIAALCTVHDLQDSATLGAAIRQPTHRVGVHHHLAQRLKVTIGVAQQGHVDDAFTVALQHGVVGQFLRGTTLLCGLRQNTLVRVRFVINGITQRKHIAPVAQRFGKNLGQAGEIRRVIQNLSPQNRVLQRRHPLDRRQPRHFLVCLM